MTAVQWYRLDVNQSSGMTNEDGQILNAAKAKGEIKWPKPIREEMQVVDVKQRGIWHVCIIHRLSYYVLKLLS